MHGRGIGAHAHGGEQEQAGALHPAVPEAPGATGAGAVPSHCRSGRRIQMTRLDTVIAETLVLLNQEPARVTSNFVSGIERERAALPQIAA